MIQIKNLTKIYDSKKADKTVALSDLSFSLPSKGMVFIIGKSGSGKSTLLNILACLDSATKGSIKFNNLELTKLNSNKLNDFRAHEIGFIFQHYYLLNDLTVKENILISNDITKTNKDIDELLVDLELSGLENKYPYELSGGQCQRVGIARALAKNPRFILGDEPTGNLDKLNSRNVMRVLKKISKDRLVVIVSHNLLEADEYADRIIELEDGKIISDRIKSKTNNKKFILKDETLYLPHNRSLTKEELIDFSSGLSNNKIKNIIQHNDGFKLFNDVIESNETTELKPSKLNFIRRNKYYKVFFKKRLKSTFFTSFIIAMLLVVVTIFGSILDESYKNIEYSKLNEHVILTNTTLNPEETSLFHAPTYTITEREMSNMRSYNYDGEIYRLYNEVIFSHTENYNLAIRENTNVISNTEELYIKEPFGVLQTNKSFIERYISKNGKINFLAGSFDGPSYGVIITDYIADSIMYYYGNKYKSYDELLGYLDTYNYDINNNITSYIIGVVETDYKEKYANIVEAYSEAKDRTEAKQIYHTVKNFDNYQKFLNDVLFYYGIGFTVNSNYKSDMTKRQMTSVYLKNLYFDDFTNEYQLASATTIYNSLYLLQSSLPKEGEIYMPTSVYNKIFNTNFNKDNVSNFTPHQVSLKFYDDNKIDKDVIYEKTFTIKDITSSAFIVNFNDFSDLINLYIAPYAVYLDNDDKVDNIVDGMNDFGFYAKTLDSEKVVGVSKLLSVFTVFFEIVYIIVYAAIVILLFINTLNNIKKNYYEIGIMNALGVRNKDIRSLYVRNIITLGILIFIINYALSPVILYFADQILKIGFANLLDTSFIELRLVDIYAAYKRFDIVVVYITLFISLGLSNIKLSLLKPIELINEINKEV